MGFVLDNLVKRIIIEDFTIDGNYTSQAIDVDGSEQGYSVQVDWVNGTSVDYTLQLEASVDGISFAPVEGGDQLISDSTGVHIWDVVGSNISFVRVVWNQTTGSADFTARLVHKRRH